MLGGWLLFNAAEWAVWVAILIFAYGATGPASVGIVAVAQLVPAAIAAPTMARLGERVSAGRALTIAYLVIGLAMVSTGAAMALGWPAPVVYLLAASVVVAYTSVRPIQLAILPALVGRAEQLTAANALSTILEGVGVLVGPLLCGVVVGFATPAAVYLGAGVATLVAALLSIGIAGATIALHPRPVSGAPDDVPKGPRGMAAITAKPSRWMSVLLLAARFGVAAAMDVLLVIAAIDLLGMGEAGAGYLSAAIGLGWVVGGATTLVIVGRPRLTPLLLIGAVIWAIPVVGIALVAQPAFALAALVRAGIGVAIVDVAVRTVLQRLVSTDQLSSVFGMAEGASMGGAAIGALSAGLLVATIGLRGAIVVSAVLLPILAIAILRPVGRGEAAVHIPFREIALLRRLPMFAPVPAPALEAAAAALVTVDLPTGATIIREGDVGDRFWVLDTGYVAVSQGGVTIARLGPGASFGELALVRDIPRTASVTALSDVRLLALDRESFLITLTASPRAVEEGTRVAASYLDRDRMDPAAGQGTDPLA